MLFQYKNIYASSYKYLKEKEKEKHKPITWKKKKTVGIVATVPIEQIERAL